MAKVDRERSIESGREIALVGNLTVIGQPSQQTIMKPDARVFSGDADVCRRCQYKTKNLLTSIRSLPRLLSDRSVEGRCFCQTCYADVNTVNTRQRDTHFGP